MKCNVLCLIALCLSAASAQAQPAAIASVLGAEAVALDPVKVAKVKAAPAGQRFYFDTDGDGKMDECWFIDSDPRHTGAATPILVKVIDTSGNLTEGIAPSHASAVWIADWQANGVADSAIIYEDNDRDGDLDAMAMYFGGYWWWARDDGDDNLLWFDQNYTYDQNACQDRCHFGGDETFFAVQFDPATKSFYPRWEAPFFFFDNNKDKRTDEVMRVTVPHEKDPTRVLTLRWSFNVTGEGTFEEPRHYTCSISAYPIAGTLITPDIATSDKLHGFKIEPILRLDKSRPWARSTKWASGLFTWVENDNNVGWGAGGKYAVTSERWEGVIGHGSNGFRNVGGPTCGPFNNRNELDLAPTGPFEYYYNPADRRIHLKNAKLTWLETDWDGDFRGDMKYTWTDRNGDGIVDHIALDLTDSGKIDDEWDIATDKVKKLDYEWKAFHDAYTPVVQKYPAELYNLDQYLTIALDSLRSGSSADPVWSMMEEKFSGPNVPEWKRIKFANSDLTLIYYLELVRDRRIAKLKALASGEKYAAFWKSFNEARTAGDTGAMMKDLNKQFGTSKIKPFAEWIAKIRKDDSKRVAAVALSNGIAWETEQAAWRVQDGRFDFLGKRGFVENNSLNSDKHLVLDRIKPGDNLSVDTGGWGMDALIEGDGPGASGLTLFVNGKAYPLYGTTPAAAYQVVEQSKDRVTVEMTCGKVGPADAPRTVRVRATAQAGRSTTHLSAQVQGGPAGDTLELGIGLTRPADSRFEHRSSVGVLGIWGEQSPAIGEVGLGLVYPPASYARSIETKDELGVILKATDKQTFYWTLQTDWRRGRRFGCFPALVNWMDELLDNPAGVRAR